MDLHLTLLSAVTATRAVLRQTSLALSIVLAVFDMGTDDSVRGNSQTPDSQILQIGVQWIACVYMCVRTGVKAPCIKMCSDARRCLRTVCQHVRQHMYANLFKEMQANACASKHRSWIDNGGRTHRWTNKQTDEQKDRWTGRRKDRQTDRRTDG